MATTKKRNSTRRGSKQQFRTRCPLVTMGKPMLGEDGWIIVNADVYLYFTIQPEMVTNAVVRSGSYCMVARALDAALGSQYKYIVGAGVIKIIDETHKVLVRFVPTGVLKAAIKKFDRSASRGEPRWDLPANLYRLAPMPKSWRQMYEDPKGYAKRLRTQKSRSTTKRSGQLIKGSKRTTVSGSTTVRLKTPRRSRAKVTRVIMRHPGTGTKRVRV